MNIFQEIKFLLSASFETGKKIWYFIIIANLGFAYFFFTKGYSDITGLVLQLLCISIFIPLILTIRQQLGNGQS